MSYTFLHKRKIYEPFISDQEERERAVTAFREGRKDVLVATDVASKGLDFPNIVHVINYDMPEDIENYGMRIKVLLIQTIILHYSSFCPTILSSGQSNDLLFHRQYYLFWFELGTNLLKDFFR